MSRLMWTLICVALAAVVVEITIIAATGQNTCPQCQTTPIGR